MVTDDMHTEVSVDRGIFTLDWTYEGEGLSGEYMPNDPEDKPLLRFTIYKKELNNDKSVTYWPVEDCSYCTLVEYGVPDDVLRGAGHVILQIFVTATSKKKAMEAMSWLEIGA